MKPTLVDNCEHYNYQTHNCNKCGRGLPDVCLEFENMKKKAEAYDTSIQPGDTIKTVTAPKGNLDMLFPDEQPTAPKKTTRPRKSS